MQTGHDFSLYKRSTLWRRIERRMNLHHLSAVCDYVRYRTKESMIDGLVITFLDTSETRKLATQLEDCQSRLAALPGKTQD